MIYILESKSSGNTIYKCQFCSYKGTKEKLVNHVEKIHPEMIPEEYTAARTVFNYLNKKDHGTCIQCGKETDWDEENWRYKRLHEKKCKAEYVKEFKKVRMVNKYGKESLLDDPKHQEKMLKNRSISGEYKFKDGTIKTYTGSYEKKALEFYDKVLNIKSSDIITPGPTFEYEYKGKKHFWITDMYYIPLNLIHDIKDGGDNPNNREMTEYREKQIAKENMIQKLNKYNYIRLTNNNFEQLLYIMAEIKTELMDSSIEGQSNYITHINESVTSTAGALPVGTGDESLYLIPYEKPDKKGIAITSNKLMNNIYIIDDDGKVVKESIEFINNSKYDIYKYNKKVLSEIWERIIPYDSKNNITLKTEDFFYKEITGTEINSIDQLEYDSRFKKIGHLFY